MTISLCIAVLCVRNWEQNSCKDDLVLELTKIIRWCSAGRWAGLESLKLSFVCWTLSQGWLTVGMSSAGAVNQSARLGPLQMVFSGLLGWQGSPGLPEIVPRFLGRCWEPYDLASEVREPSLLPCYWSSKSLSPAQLSEVNWTSPLSGRRGREVVATFDHTYLAIYSFYKAWLKAPLWRLLG